MKLSHIWRCSKCRCRYKTLGGVGKAPKECKCGNTQFIPSSTSHDNEFR